MDVRIATLPAFRLAYLRCTGPYGGPGIPQTWQALTQWCAEHGLNGTRRHMFGISLDNPQTTPAAQCRYDAAVELAADETAAPPVQTQQLPGGLYACTRFRGSSAEIGAAWQALCGPWLDSSAYQFELRPCFEHYPADIDCLPEPGIFVCDLCVPVRPR